MHSTKLKIADVIINLNLLESKMSDIIAYYVNSEKVEFVREILLNSLFINFSSKVNVLRYIFKKEQIDPDEELFKAIKIVMTKRNIIAHSESLLKLEQEIVDIDYDWNHDDTLIFPIYELTEPTLPVINDGTVNYENISRIVADFDKYYKIADQGLQSLSDQLEQLQNE